MKKIVCIHLLNDFSGSPFILSQSIDTLIKNNYLVDLYTSDTEGFLSSTKANRFNVFYKRVNNKIFVLLNYLISQVILFFKLLKYKNDDVIFYINTIMPFGAGLAGKILGKKVIYHIHETSIRPKILKLFLRKVINSTSSLNIFVSIYLKKIEEIKNIDSIVMYNALPNTFIKKASLSKYSYIQDKFKVLMICSLKEYKGVHEFIKVAKKCESNKNIKFELVLNASQNDIDSFFTKMSSNNISIYPSQKDVTIFYKDTNLLLNLSRIDEWIETFGMTILEGMSYGIPCVVPPIGGPMELVDHGINGYCISSYQVEDIAKLILNISMNKELLLVLSTKAKEKAQIFSNKNFEKSILNVFTN